MAVRFNADEIFEIAEQMERNGAEFYRRAAEGIQAEEAKQVLMSLAAMEDEHLRTFSTMRQELTASDRIPTSFDPDGQAAQYLRAMAGGHVFDLHSDPVERLRGNETPADIYRMALGLEKDSIVFYTGIEEMVPEDLGRGRVRDIIRQEMGHVSLLSKELQKAGG